MNGLRPRSTRTSEWGLSGLDGGLAVGNALVLSISLYGDEQDLDTIAGLHDAGGDRGGLRLPIGSGP